MCFDPSDLRLLLRFLQSALKFFRESLHSWAQRKQGVPPGTQQGALPPCRRKKLPWGAQGCTEAENDPRSFLAPELGISGAASLHYSCKKFSVSVAVLLPCCPCRFVPVATSAWRAGPAAERVPRDIPAIQARARRGAVGLASTHRRESWTAGSAQRDSCAPMDGAHRYWVRNVLSQGTFSLLWTRRA